MKPKLIMMIGISGSGKSTIANNLGYEVVSSDKLRGEMFGDVNEQGKNDELFKEVHRRIKQNLIDGKDTVYDATNLNMKKRRHFLQHELRGIECEKIAVVVATPVHQCRINDHYRERSVGEEIINKQFRKFNFPLDQEGFDKIEIEYPYGKSPLSEFFSLFDDLWEFDQESKHHSLTLGGHLSRAHEYLSGLHPNSYYLAIAGLFHDCAKPYVKSFKNSKGEAVESATYYSHENCSSYLAMFYMPLFLNNEDSIKVCQLIQWHMKPYFIKKEKTKQKYLKFLGEEFYNDLIKLHRADKFAH